MGASALYVVSGPGISSTQKHLRRALHAALERGDWGVVQQCVGASLDAQRRQWSTRDVFGAIDAGDVGRAVEQAGRQRSADPLRRMLAAILVLYTALEGATRGERALAGKAVATARTYQAEITKIHLCNALVARAALEVTRQSGAAENEDAAALLASWGWDGARGTLISMQRVMVGDQPADDEDVDLFEMLEDRAHLLEHLLVAESPLLRALSEEDTQFIWEMSWVGLAQAISDPRAATLNERFLKLALLVPTPHERLNTLLQLAYPCACLPDIDLMRSSLRRIFACLLDTGANPFSFELASVLLVETRRRGIEAPQLATYLGHMRGSRNRMGTGLRAGLAHAAALFHAGSVEQAAQEFASAVQLDPGVPYWACLHLLTVAARWHELGRPPLSDGGADQDPSDRWLAAATALLEGIGNNAARAERAELVQAYRDWLNEATPDIPTVRLRSATIGTENVDAFQDFIAGRFAHPATSDRTAKLSALIPITLAVQANPDASLSRLIALHVRELSDDALLGAIQHCRAWLPPLDPIDDVDHHVDPTVVARACRHLGAIAYNNQRYPRAQSFFQHSLSLDVQERDDSGIADAYRGLALTSARQGDFDSASQSYQQSVAAAERAGAPIAQAGDLTWLGNTALKHKDYKAAQTFFELAGAAYSQQHDQAGYAKTLNNQAIALGQQRAYDAAFALFQQGWEAQREAGDVPNPADNLGWLGNIAAGFKEYEQARRFYQLSLERASEQGDRRLMGLAWFNLGTTAFYEQNYDEARHLLQQSLDLLRQLAEDKQLAQVLNNLAFVAFTQQDYATARPLLLESITIGERTGWDEVHSARATLVRVDRALAAQNHSTEGAGGGTID